MRARSRRYESRHRERVTVDGVHTAADHVGDVEHPAGGVELHVLRLGVATVECESAHDGLAANVDLHELAGELAARDQVTAVGGEVDVVDADTVDVQ